MAWTLFSSDFHFRIMHVILKKFMNVMTALRICLYYFPVMWTVEDCLLVMLKSSRKNAIQLHNNIIHSVNKYFSKNIYGVPTPYQGLSQVLELYQ